MRGSLFTVIIGQAGAFVNPGPAGIFSATVKNLTKKLLSCKMKIPARGR